LETHNGEQALDCRGRHGVSLNQTNDPHSHIPDITAEQAYSEREVAQHCLEEAIPLAVRAQQGAKPVVSYRAT
jgi:hypothetical protein